MSTVIEQPVVDEQVTCQRALELVALTRRATAAFGSRDHLTIGDLQLTVVNSEVRMVQRGVCVCAAVVARDAQAGFASRRVVRFVEALSPHEAQIAAHHPALAA